MDKTWRVMFSHVIGASLILGLAVGAAWPSSAEPTKPAADEKAIPKASVYRNLKPRNIGPANMGGRIDAIAVVDNNPAIVYVAAATGGIMKTTNNGITWAFIFDNETVSSIGDIAIAPSDPSILYVGTGEANNRQSSSWGNGVYKTLDAGLTWRPLGLNDTQAVGRVVIHPQDPNTVYVAAAGHLWGPNKERGVFKSSDGGQTWRNVFFINEDTGAIDAAMDPQSPNTLYAAMYQRRRTVFGFNGGGPGSGLYKTIDGGATWTKLTKGLPTEGDLGRIGVSIYRSNPNIVYAVVQHQKEGGVYRSDNKGESWTKMSDTNPRPMYYSQIRIDPGNDQRLWLLGAPMYYSEDGGKTFRNNLVQRIHGDYHALWIDPANSNHMWVGSDGGIHQSYDRGLSWAYINTVPLAQFYEASYDLQQPYRVCGGLQDNGSWCGPSATLAGSGITNADWFRVGGGDGFYTAFDSADPMIVYSESQDGFLSRLDLRTGERKSIRPEPKEGAAPYRFHWNSPLILSAHNPKTIYFAGNFMFKSTDRGDHWVTLGADLTTGIERNQLPIFGVIPTKERDTLSRHDGVQQYPTATTLAESPINPDVLYFGSDDGHLQVTRDGGKTWKNVAGNIPELPKGTYVSRVVASQYAVGSVYATFDGHRMNDFNTYVYRSADYGEHWKSLASSLPKRGGVHVLREHPRNADLLFLGTEFGVFISFNGGGAWEPFKLSGFPTVPVYDLQIHPRANDLILATHGRGLWILDDITPLEYLSDRARNEEVFAFPARTATAYRINFNQSATGHQWFSANDPPSWAVLNYYLKNKPGEKEEVLITITDKSGKVVRELVKNPKEADLNRVEWDLRHDPPVKPAEESQERAPEAAAAGFFGFGMLRGPRVLPGEYQVRIALTGPKEKDEKSDASEKAAKAEKSATTTVKVEEDPRITVAEADRQARFDVLMQLGKLYATADEGQKYLGKLRVALKAVQEDLKKMKDPKAPEDLLKAADALAKEADAAYDKFTVERTDPLGNAGPPLTYEPPRIPQRLQRLATSIDGVTEAPSARQREDLQTAAQLLEEANTMIKKVKENLAAFNKQVNEAGLPRVNPETAAPPPRPRGRRGELP
ncbi:MAG: hypothetical protein HYR55_02745 [Acidobacteria bacterium]|nr:hypothetical protein [Acidobacteriota bacterium]MBI3656258.1 hypothetical protein [Acidobacteriota bacterium]